MVEKKELTWNEALKILKFPRGTKPTDEQITKAVKKAAKKHHPDLFANAERETRRLQTKKFQLITEAATILRNKRDMQQKQLTPGYERYLVILMTKIPFGSDDAFTDKIISQEQTKIADEPQIEYEKFKDAVKIFEQRRLERERFQALIKGKTRLFYLRAAKRVLMDPEERRLEMLIRKARAIIVKDTFKQMAQKIPTIFNKVKRIKGKPYVPIEVKLKYKKPIKRYVLLTTSMLIAIIGGKYVWNWKNGSYKKKALVVVKNG